jgi:TonB-linked SusC/RagA family outer membrane protein
MKKMLFRITFKKCFLTMLMMFLTLSSFGQKMKIKGTVADENNLSLPGVQISVKGSSTGTISNIDGVYEINVEKNNVLVFRCMGFLDQSINITNQSVINIKMTADVQKLNEVVVIGYGTVKRKDLTGSVGSADISDMNKAPVASFESALAGRVSGVQVTSSEGKPGAPTSIKIRGTGSLTQDSSPLFVVDGFPIEDFDMSSIAPSDIESMDVLKGPSAIAIYGARGGNGVIVITTVSGVKGKATVTYNAFKGYETISKRVDVMSPYDFVDLQHEVDPLAAYNAYGPLSAYLKEDGTSIKGINWQDETFNQTEIESHTVSVNGGNSDTRYNLSLSNYSGTGLLSNSGFERTYMKLKLDQKVTDKVKVGTNISYTISTVNGAYTSTNILDPSASGSGGSNGRFNLLKDIVQGRPTGGLFYSNQELLTSPEDPETEAGAPITNPLVNALSTTREDVRNAIIFNGYLQYSFTKSLNLKVNAGIQKTFRKLKSFDDVNSAFERRNGFTHGQITNDESTNSLISTTLNFNKKYKNIHSVGGLLGFDYQNILFESVTAFGSVFPDINLGVDDLGSGTEPGFSSSYKSPTDRLISWFYRFNYSYDGKYFFTNTLRNDGSSKFGDNNKFGLFPSMSVAWRFSSEDFLKDSKVISDGKLRFEWGQVGNNKIPGFVSKSLLSTGSYGGNNGTIAGVYPANLNNPDIKWESQEQINIGLDLGFFNNRIIFNADAYSKESNDLLLLANLPTSVGFANVYRNIGKIQNQGLEFSLSTINIDNKLKWNSSLNFTFPKTKTLSLVNQQDVRYDSSSWYSSTSSGDPYANDFITRVGEPFGLMYGYLDDGLYRDEDFDSSGRPYVSVSFGDEVKGYRKYVDVDKNGTIDEKDKVVIGNPNPIFFGSLSNTLNYKNFDLSIFFQWSYGNDIYNANRVLWTSDLTKVRNFVPEIINRWRGDNAAEENDLATFRSILDKSAVLTDNYIEDGSFIRLKTVSLGYTFPKKWMKKLNIESLRIYTSAQNLITWTNYTGYDPEVSTRGNGLTSGVDFGAYPRSKTFIGGLSVAF